METKQKATLPPAGSHTENGRNYADTKETIQERTLVVCDGGEMRTPIIARWYMGRSRSASVVYCSVWIHAPGVSCAGHGSAGGYGYHKQSAALSEALDSAGVKLEQDIHGRGDGSIREAFEAISAALGYAGMPQVTL